MPKKKFIDKKKAVSFHLVHRSQHDPLAADETAPQHVLVPARSEITEKNKEEERKYGIYFDDNYNYLQHIRNANLPDVVWVQDPDMPTKNDRRINLPSSVFASEVEENVGLLNRAAPMGLCLGVDPDIVAAMDDDFDYSNEQNILDDNFVQMANGNDDTDNTKSEYDGDDDYDEMYDDYKLSDFEEEKQSRFTEYSMTSSVLSRNSNLTLLDEKFDEMYAKYDRSEIGALDCDIIEGEIDMDSDVFKSALKEFQDTSKPSKETSVGLSYDRILRGYESDSNSDQEMDRVRIEKKEKWDCESILSTYSNLYNHPQIIKEPRVSKIIVDKKTGIPIDSTKLTKKSLAQFDKDNNCGKSSTPSVISRLSALSIRDKCETLEQKRDRKKQIKKYRQERRLERKLNREAFKDEKRKMEKMMVNNKLQCQGLLL